MLSTSHKVEYNLSVAKTFNYHSFCIVEVFSIGINNNNILF